MSHFYLNIDNNLNYIDNFCHFSKNLFPWDYKQDQSVNFSQLKNDFSNEWLLNLELYELALQNNYKIQFEISNHLETLKEQKSITKLIESGLNLLELKEHQS